MNIAIFCRLVELKVAVQYLRHVGGWPSIRGSRQEWAGDVRPCLPSSKKPLGLTDVHFAVQFPVCFSPSRSLSAGRPRPGHSLEYDNKQ